MYLSNIISLPVSAFLRKAQEQADRDNATRYIVTIDCGDEREMQIADEEYVTSEEFAAFEGRIVSEIEPNTSGEG